jgi:hypothetical protein
VNVVVGDIFSVPVRRGHVPTLLLRLLETTISTLFIILHGPWLLLDSSTISVDFPKLEQMITRMCVLCRRSTVFPRNVVYHFASRGRWNCSKKHGAFVRINSRWKSFLKHVSVARSSGSNADRNHNNSTERPFRDTCSCPFNAS